MDFEKDILRELWSVGGERCSAPQEKGWRGDRAQPGASPDL